MRVLVNESENRVADHAVHLLEQHGHQIVRCHEFDDEPFPCAALRPDSACPFEGEGVDIAVTVRSEGSTSPTAWEDGIACALRNRVPVVVAGAAAENPYSALGGVEVDGEHVVQPCEWIVSSPSPSHTEIATEALLAALKLPRGDAEAVVWRDRHRLRVSIDTVPSVAIDAVRRATPKVMLALRSYDRAARVMDIEVAQR